VFYMAPLGAIGERLQPKCMLRPTRERSKSLSLVQEHCHGIPDNLRNCIFICERKTLLGRRPAPEAGAFQCVMPESCQGVSGDHAAMFWADGRLIVVDKSSNGTFFGSSDQSMASFSRLPRNEEGSVQVGSFVMLAQWPEFRRAEDVVLYAFLIIHDQQCDLIVRVLMAPLCRLFSTASTTNCGTLQV
jgi:hypothetical protein